MKPSTRSIVCLLTIIVLIAGLSSASNAQGRTKIRYALGDVISIDELPLLIAVEQVKTAGRGRGGYFIQERRSGDPGRDQRASRRRPGHAICGSSKALGADPVFLPVKLAALFPRRQQGKLQDLEGSGWARDRSSRPRLRNRSDHDTGGEGTRHQVQECELCPGSQVRALALLKGNIRATILDAPNKNLVMKDGADKFIILPLGNVKASDEALFAMREFLDKNQAGVRIFIEELTKVARAINANPKWVLEQRKKLGLLKDLPAKMEEEILPFFQEAVENGVYPNDGGFGNAAKNDLEFFYLSGALKGENLKAEDFWDLGPLKSALANVK